MKKDGQNKMSEDSTTGLATKERSLEANFLHRKIKETSKLLVRHREKIDKMREQESVLEEDLRNLGRVIDKVERYEQATFPNLSLQTPEGKMEKVLA